MKPRKTHGSCYKADYRKFEVRVGMAKKVHFGSHWRNLYLRPIPTDRASIVNVVALGHPDGIILFISDKFFACFPGLVTLKVGEQKSTRP